MSRQGQVLWNELGGRLVRFNPAVHHYLQGLHPRPDAPKAVALMAEQVARQAEMLAMIDVFQPITWSFIVMLPLVFFLRKKQVESGPTPVAAE